MEIKQGIGVHCETEEEARQFLAEAHKRGFHWIHKDSNATRWIYFQHNTVYFLNPYDYITYGDVRNYKDREIIKFKNLKIGE